MTRVPTSLALAVLLALAACEGSTSATDAGPDAVADLPADPGADAPTDLPADLPDVSGPPILERAPRIERTCSVLHDAVTLAEPFDSWLGADLVVAGGGALLVRALPDGSDYKLVVSTLDVAGTMGPAKTLSTPGEWTMPYPSAVATGAGLAAAYAAGSGTTRIEFVAADAAGTVLHGPATVAGTQGLAIPSLAATGNGYGLLAASNQTATMRFLRLDAAGVAQGAPVAMPVQGQYAAYPGPRLQALPDGFLAAWTESGDRTSAVVARLDATGAVAGAPLRIAPEGLGAADPRVAPVAGGHLLAYTESWRPEDWNQSGWTVVKVQRLGADLSPQGEAQRLQAPAEAIACHSPRWVDLDGLPGLSWDCGVLYNVCAGCVSTEQIGFMALHPGDLVPGSAPITLKSATGGGGLLNPVYARVGDDWLVFSMLTFHATSQPSLAAMRCTAP